ncbi:hypothetical protein CEP54_010321 [Fusarium duplospermum]|uniref:Uncharacterized protein n=1 Tax=Fusarium duplospermum TaxID=1325734 RepID=A0A428PKW4_9HYPO|nr:hypothetical protein CEP54_010321 [Fusarium duplospermum]
MAKQWNTSSKRKRQPCKLPRNAKILKHSVNLKRKRQVTDVGGTPKAQRLSQAPQRNNATPVTKRGQKNRPNRGRKAPNDPNGCNTSSNPQYIGPYLVTNSPERNPELGSLNIPNNPHEPNTSARPQYLGPYLVTSDPDVSTKSESLRILTNLKREDAPENAQHIAAHPVTNIQKGKHGKERPSAKFQYSENYPEANGPKKNHRHRHRKPKSSQKQRASANYQHGGTSQVAHRRKKNRGKRGGRFPNRQENPEGVGAPPDSQDVGPRPVANQPEAAFPEPQLKSPKGLDPKGLQASASPQTFHTPVTSTISPQLATSLRKQIDQDRPISRRHSTGKLPVLDKLSNKFVMRIPKQRFGIGRRRDSTASAPPVITAEYCNDPYRTVIKERLAAGEPRAPPRSEFANDSDNYHAAGKVSKSMSKVYESEETGLMKQATSLIAGMAYKQYFELRIEMQVSWIGYDELVSFLGHRQAIEETERATTRFFRAALRITGMRTIRRRSPANRQKDRDHIKAAPGRFPGRVQKTKRNRLRENIKELKQGR